MLPISYIYWDPRPEIFIIPILNVPILWYGALFALGFALGFPLFTALLHRYFLQRPDFDSQDLQSCPDPKGSDAYLRRLNEQLVSSEPMDHLLIGKEARPATYSLHPQAALRRLKLEKIHSESIIPLRKLAVRLADRLTVYVVVATVLGARIGHFLFYEKPSEYLRHPWEILQVWKGGLASHGAAIAIVLALGLFARLYRKELRGVDLIRLLDFISVPTALGGGLIRVGNFFNQEILGKKTTVPWAIIFGHPADRSLPAPRHPVQLYEAIFYFLVFFLLWNLSFRAKYLLEKGRLIGLFLILVFGFRFAVEFWKMEQSYLIPRGFDLTMGQILSIPAIIAGALLYFYSRFKYSDKIP